MSIASFFKAFGSDALKVGEVAAPIAAQIFLPQFAGAVKNLVAAAEQKFPPILPVQLSGSSGVVAIPGAATGPHKLDWVKTSITAALPFIEALAAQHGIKITATEADITAAIEASVTACKADVAAVDAVKKLFTQPTEGAK